MCVVYCCSSGVDAMHMARELAEEALRLSEALRASNRSFSEPESEPSGSSKSYKEKEQESENQARREAVKKVRFNVIVEAANTENKKFKAGNEAQQ